MPRFPDAVPLYEPADPPPPVFDEDLNNALAARGLTFDDILDAYHTRQDQQARFDAGGKLAAHVADTQAAAAAAKAAMPADAIGFHDAFMATRIAPDKAFLNSIHPSQRDSVSAAWKTERDKIGDLAASIEYEGRGRYESDQLLLDRNRGTMAVAADPTSAPVELARLNKRVDDASSLSADQKLQLKSDNAKELSIAALVALYGDDPDGMRAELGVPHPLAGPAAGVVPLGDGSLTADSAAPAVTMTGPAAAEALPPASAKATAVEEADPAALAATSAQMSPAAPPASGGSDASPPMPAAGYTNASADRRDTVLSATATSKALASPAMLAGTAAVAPSTMSAAPANPIWGPIPRSARPGLVNEATVRQAAAQGSARIDLEDRLDSIKNDLTSTGHTSRPLPTSQDFALAYGLLGARPQYTSFQDIVKVGAAIDSIKTLNHEQLMGLIASRAKLAANTDAAADDFKTLSTAAAINQQKRLDDPAGYTVSTFGIDPAGFTSQDPTTVKRTIAAQKLHQDQLGIPVEAQKLLPKAIARQTVDTFNNEQLSPEERISGVLQLLRAAPNPQARGILVSQLIEAGLPDAVAGAVSAFNRSSDDPDAQEAVVTLLNAAMRRPSSEEPASLGNLHLAPTSVGAQIESQLNALGIPALKYRTDIPNDFNDRQARLREDENFQQLDRDFRLLFSDAQGRIKAGENTIEASTHAMADVYGPVKRIQGSYFDAIVSNADNKQKIASGAYALLPKIEEQQRKLQAQTPPAPGAPAEPTDPAKIAYDGYFANAPGGQLTDDFVFIDRSTGAPIKGQDGNAVIFRRADIIQAGEIADRTTVSNPVRGRPQSPEIISQSQALRRKYKDEGRDQANLATDILIEGALSAIGPGELELAAKGGIAAFKGLRAFLTARKAARLGEPVANGSTLLSEIGSASAGAAGTRKGALSLDSLDSAVGTKSAQLLENDAKAGGKLIEADETSAASAPVDVPNQAAESGHFGPKTGSAEDNGITAAGDASKVNTLDARATDVPQKMEIQPSQNPEVEVEAQTTKSALQRQPAEDNATRGGTYVLRDDEGKIVRSGRTNSHVRREAEHRRDKNLGSYKFQIVHKTDNYNEQRGLEEILHRSLKPKLNKIGAVSSRNKKKKEMYEKAAEEFLKRQSFP